MNICFHIILLICILQVLAHSPRHESKSHKIGRHGGKKLKTIKTSGVENRFKSLANFGNSRTKKLKSADPKQWNEPHVKKLAQKRRKGKKKQLKNRASGLHGSVKNKAVNAGALRTSKLGQKRIRPHHRKIQKSVAKKGRFKIHQDLKRRIRPGQKKNPSKHNRVPPKNSGIIKHRNGKTRRRGIKIGTKTIKQKYEPVVETVKILASKPSEEKKQTQDAPLSSDNVNTPKHREEITPTVTIETAPLTQKQSAEKIDLAAKEPTKTKEENQKDNHKIQTENKHLPKEEDHKKVKSSQVTEISQTTTTEDDFLKFFKQSETEVTTTTTEKPKEEKTLREYLQGIINDEEYRLYYTNDIYDSDIPNLCLKHRQIAQKLFDKGFDRIFFPSCADDGSFHAKQCDNYWGSPCWCIDTKTGQKVSGSCEPKAKNIVFRQPLPGSKRELSNYERIKKRQKERARLRKVQKEKAWEIFDKSCNFHGEYRCVMFEPLLQGVPELPKQIVQAYDGIDKTAGDKGQVYQRAFDILKKLNLDTNECQPIISHLPFLQSYMDRFSESCDARNNLFDEIIHADPFWTN